MAVKSAERLYLSNKDKKIAGVCGGVAQYLGIDPTIVRLIWLLLAFAGGFGILAYLVAWIIVPRNPNSRV